MHDIFKTALNIALLIFGFGFVVFFHELGHFLAAKWVGIKVEQFAVGFGQALVSFRKGIGTRLGSTQKEFAQRIEDHSKRKLDDTSELERAAAAHELGLSETEYRLNWMPLGGYVKMLGQDDMNPNSQSDDPRAYNRKSIGARMIVVSAGVIMNVILAFILFAALFLYGYNVPPPVVASIQTNSPAQQAGMQVGDRILYFDNSWQYDYTSLRLNIALVKQGAPVPVYVKHPDGKEEQLTIYPRKANDKSTSFLDIGVGQYPPSLLQGADPKRVSLENYKQAYPDAKPETSIFPGDRITRIGNEDVQPKDTWKLHKALQDAAGNPITVTVVNSAGVPRTITLEPRFEETFGAAMTNFAGMQPRVLIVGTEAKSPANGIILPGDVLISVHVAGETFNDPDIDEFKKIIADAVEHEKKVAVTVLRDGKEVKTPEIIPNFRTASRTKGLGVALSSDASQAVVSHVLTGSAADKAKPVAQPNAVTGIPRGARIVSINDKSVTSWYDVLRELKQAPTGNVNIVTQSGKDAPVPTVMTLSDEDRSGVSNIRLTLDHQLLNDWIEPRKTTNPLIASKWGVIETRNLLLQFYVTLFRLKEGSVSASNFMGPVGIATAGYMFATKGTDWLIWFLAMITANLAVVNFLPIPIVDGGLFTFLIIEKIKGKPLSPKLMQITQLVGLGILISIFVFVTYNDVLRTWF